MKKENNINAYEAIVNGDMEKVEAWISNTKKEDIDNVIESVQPYSDDSSFEYYYTALSAAVHHNQTEIADLLLKNGANPNSNNYNDEFGDCVLNQAIYENNVPMVKLLLDNGASVSKASDEIFYNPHEPLELAVSKNLPEMVKLLIEKNADVNFQEEENGNSLLMMAIQNLEKNESKTIMSHLLYGDIDVNLQNNDGETALMHLATKGAQSEVDALLSRDADIMLEDQYGATAITYAQMGHNADIAKQLKNMAFIQSAEKGKLPEMKALLADGVDINAINKYNATALTRASSAGKYDAVAFLLSENAAVNFGGHHGYSALHCAAEAGHSKIAQLLIEYGADVNAQTKYNETPLMAAAAHGKSRVTNLLLKEGADINEQDDFGQTAMDKATQNEHSVPEEDLARVRNILKKAQLVEKREQYREQHRSQPKPISPKTMQYLLKKTR